MHLALDICQGIGIAAAVGIRPFLPALLVGAMASGNAIVDFGHTDYAFLERTGFLLALVVAVVLLTAAERRLGTERLERGPLAPTLAAIGPALGALLFAASLAQDRFTSWPGLPAGVACSLIAYAASRDLFARTRARLDAQAGAALPAYAEATGLVLAALSVVAPPVGPLALAFLAWLLVTGRRRAGRKYAGLRVLR